MNILDENVVETQCRFLRKWRIRFRQIGFGLGSEGMKDNEIISLLNDLTRPTFFTRDNDFFDRNLCHAGYCLVHTSVEKTKSLSSRVTCLGTRSSTPRRNGWVQWSGFLMLGFWSGVFIQRRHNVLTGQIRFPRMCPYGEKSAQQQLFIRMTFSQKSMGRKKAV
jgi:hypothetical protein